MDDIRESIMTRNEICVQRNRDFIETFSGPHGERVLQYLSKFCLEKSGTFVVDSKSKSAYNEGARSAILEIRHWLDMDITKLNKEQSNE